MNYHSNFSPSPTLGDGMVKAGPFTGPHPPLESVEGKKYDKGKSRYDLLSPLALEGIARVLTYGAFKYGDRNWEAGLSWSRCFGAAMRHLWAWWKGEEYDVESGLPHLDHAACCIMFLKHFTYTKPGFDDRTKEKW